MSDRQPILLLTNDDGWDAPGLAALWAGAAGIGSCRVAAPDSARSGCGHQVTTHAPISVARLDDHRMAIAGTPADCVRLAIHHLVPGMSWVISGINAGGNLGVDIHHSGTVAAVREGVIHGVPGIALSQFIARGRPIDWPRAARWAGQILRRLIDIPLESGTFWNVNLPHLTTDEPDPELVICPPDASPLPLNYHVDGDLATYCGEYPKRQRTRGSDIDVCFSGRIAASLIRLF